MKQKSWQCPKCNYYDYETDQFGATSGKVFSRMFNFQSRKFSTITCKKCQFTEIYKASPGKMENIFDILTGG